MTAQLRLFDAAAPDPAVLAAKPPHGKTKCRRAECGRSYADHRRDIGCAGFIGPEDVAKPPKRVPSTSERLYKEAYESGIREGAPQIPFHLSGARVGSMLGTAAAAHAKDGDGNPLGGSELLVWIREKAREFRKATDGDPKFTGWEPIHFGRWLNMGSRVGAVPMVRRGSMLQPMPAGGLDVRPMSLAEAMAGGRKA